MIFSKKSLIKFITLITIIIVILLLTKILNLYAYIGVTQIRDFVFSFGVLAPIIFMILFIIFAVLLFPGSVLFIASGFLFGNLLGSILGVLGATLGASIAFLFSRGFGKSFVQELFENKLVRLNKYNHRLKEHGFISVLTLRLIPLFPYNGSNYALGLTKVKFLDYFFGTLIGLIPVIVILVYLGDSIANLDIINIVIAIILFSLFASIYPIYRHLRKRKRKRLNIIEI